MYEATFTNAARKSIENLPETAKNRIKNRIDALISDENVRGAIKLKGQLDGNDVFRIRIGDYRVLYTFPASSKIIILDVGHRRDVYRRR
ncbi:MAG: type II toxin-antitoxin system RelE/ParE family toxin [Nitrospinae bacterium]|nr:type II toxin-antitoxin system RelE/ParE family toxin [Nitrospinota bacterium]